MAAFQQLNTRMVPAAIALLLVAGCGGAKEDAVTAAGFDPALRERITVSGISSGAYMAVQAHVALADRIGGAAALAGGPWHCAEGSVQTALGRCISGEGLDAAPFVDYANEAATGGDIAPLSTLADSRAWIFHSPADGIIAPRLGQVLRDFYLAFLDADDVLLVDNVDAAHGFPTRDTGVACNEMGGDYLNACDYDAAGELLAFLYGELEPRVKEQVGDNLREIDVSRFFVDGSDVSSDGYVYVPSACINGDCRLHVVFHGCRQAVEWIGGTFVTGAGYNEWAEANGIVVAYPQIEKSMFNPQGCWDWWGYTGPGYDTRRGKQVVGVAALIDAFVAGRLFD